MSEGTPSKRPLAANILTVLAGLLGAACLVGIFSAPYGQTPRWVEACMAAMMLAMGLPLVIWPVQSSLPWSRLTVRLLGAFFFLVAAIGVAEFLGRGA